MKSSQVSAYLLCGALMAAIFVLDALTPLGVAAGVPYVAVVLLALRLPRPSVVLFAAVATVLTALGFWKTSGAIAEVRWMALANRLLAIFAIWTTTLFSLQRKRAEEALAEHRDRLEVMVEERTASIEFLHHELEAALTERLETQQAKLHLFHSTMRTVKDIVNNFLNDLQLFRLEIEQGKTLDPQSLQALDALIQEASAKLNRLGELKEIREKDLGGGVFMIETDTPDAPP